MKYLPLILILPSLAIAQATTQSLPEIRRGIPMTGEHGERARQFMQNMARRIEPTGHGTADRLDVYLDFFSREFIEDKRQFAFSAAWVGDHDHINLTGYAEFPEHKQGLVQFLNQLGFNQVTDQIEQLPSLTLAENRFGIVTVDHAFVYDRPSGHRETLAEYHKGDPVFLLKQADGGFLCHGSAAGYVGFIDTPNIERIDATRFDATINHDPPRDADKIERIIAAASAFKGTPYVWGGSSNKGIDCSGLVYCGFGSVGIATARDADQQSQAGRLVATRWHRSSMRRGDLMYFLSRRGNIHHTAIYLGNDQFLEATDPVVTISSLNPKDKNYSQKRDESFCFAKRVIE